jgi:hypothetical protein
MAVIMNNTPPLSKLEKAEKELYSKDPHLRKTRPATFSDKEYSVKDDWGEGDDIPQPMRHANKSFWYKFLTFSVIFFIFALALSAFIFWRGTNVVSSENVDIVVNGPVSTAAGEEMAFQISILNRNNIALQRADLIVEYPQGTISSEDGSSMPRQRENLGKVNSGERIQKVMKAILFGEENEKKIINIVVEYRVEGSNATFQKEKSYEIVISSAPISLLVSGPNEISSGGEMELSIIVASNSEKAIPNAAVVVNYPFGFVFKEANPSPSSGNNYWSLGDFAPNAQTAIRIKGTMEGQNDEERVFRIEAGTGGRTQITTLFTSFLHPIALRRPALSLDISVSGNRSKTVAVMPGENLRIDLLWKNNLANQVSDAQASAKVITSGFDLTNFSAPTGFFRAQDNTILWTRDKEKSLAFLNPGESGVLNFTFRVPTVAELASSGGIFENPHIELLANIRGNNLAVSGTSGDPDTRETRIIKISSPVSVSANVFKKSDTVYSVVLTVRNPFNNLSGVKLTATVPTYMSWTNTYAPSEEAISFNSFGGQILWNVGRVSSGVGYTKPSRQISFDLTLDTTLEGLGSSPSILTDIKISGDDEYTLEKVEHSLSSVKLSS